MGDIFYTSDLHIGHKLVAGIRGFWYLTENWAPNSNPDTPDVKAHDEDIAENWDRVVKKDDVVYVLGDISINGGQHALDWIEQRPGTKHLIAGNHDPVHPQDRRASKLQKHWLKYFESINPFLRRKLEGESVLLSHYPYWSFGDGEGRGPARYEQYRLPELGDRLLHGHTHGAEVIHGRQFHVGLDAHDLELVPQEEILNWIRSEKE